MENILGNAGLIVAIVGVYLAWLQLKHTKQPGEVVQKKLRFFAVVP